MDALFFDKTILGIFGRAMSFKGAQLDLFISDYTANLTRLFVHSALEHIGEIADKNDMEKLLELTTEIEEGETDDATDLGEFLGEKLMEYPEASRKVEKEISNFNEGILSDFMARAQLKYVVELGKYINETLEKNKRVGEMIERMKKEPVPQTT